MYLCSLYVFPTTSLFFFFNDTATTEIYTLSLHDALPISTSTRSRRSGCVSTSCSTNRRSRAGACASARDRKSTRLNSSHLVISYAVFCLKKKKKKVRYDSLDVGDIMLVYAVSHVRG